MDGLVGECLHCGLPATEVGGYCCYGCELVAGLVAESSETTSALHGRLFAAGFFTMNLMAVSLVLWSEDLYGAQAGPGLSGMRDLFRVVAGLCATPVVALLGLPLLARARRGLARGQARAEMLVVFGAGAAFLVSWWRALAGAGAIYFDAAAATLVLYTAGRALEAAARARALGGLMRSRTGGGDVRRRTAAGSWERVSPSLVVAGDRLRVPVGAAAPVDGRLLEDAASVDNSVVTGESETVILERGATVPAGALALNHAFEIEALASARDSSQAATERLAGRALAGRADAERTADRAARLLVPSVGGLALATALGWWWAGDPERALTATVAVLVVACPCSFGIAVPLALRAALARAGEAGIEIADAAALERLAAARTFIFDKTGTLTARRPTVARFELLADIEEAEVLAAVRALESHSVHPVAEAVVALAEERGVGAVEASSVTVDIGRGVRGRVAGAAWEVGDGRRLAGLASEAPSTPGILVLRDGRPVARFELSAPLRARAREAVAELLGRGLHVAIASGDDPVTTAKVAEQLGIDGVGALAPAGKLEHLEALAAARGPVAMVGDGSNDAPALAGAGVGVAWGSDCDLVGAVADIRCPKGNLEDLVWLHALARRTLGVVRANLGWAVGYNALCLLLAARGDLAPAAAVLAMLLSSATVVGNSARLLRHPLPQVSVAPAKDLFGKQAVVLAAAPFGSTEASILRTSQDRES